MSTRRRRSLRPVLDQLDDRCLLSGLTPAQVTSAYGLDAINFSTASGAVKGDGSGQTIALIEAYHDPFLASDLTTFDRAFNLPDPPRLIVANQAGGVTQLWLGPGRIHGCGVGALRLRQRPRSSWLRRTRRAVRV